MDLGWRRWTLQNFDVVACYGDPVCVWTFGYEREEV